MPDHVKQHTLPKFYIALFGDSTEKPSKNSNVWYYPLDEPLPRKWRRERAQDISVRGDYYSLLNSPPEKRLVVEKFFADVESAAAPALKSLALGQDLKVGSLSLFVATMMARPPVLIEGFAAFASRLSGRPDTSYPDRARNKPRLIESLGVNLRAMVEDVEPRLRRMTWNVFITTDEEPPFISSDCPVATTLPINGSREEDLDHPGCEISMPLTKRAAVLIAQPGSGPRGMIHACKPGAVHAMNVRTVTRASSFLIAPSPTFPGVEELVR
ncbi:MAG: DUF4238 domain-containing protein [Thermoanaerobaculia bacterium]